MSSIEFLLFIPGVIYGVGVVDLLKIFKSKMYWEIIAWGIVLFLSLIIQWFTLFERLNVINMDIGLFTILLLGPLVYTMTCTVLTPEEEDLGNTEMYFLNIRRKFFIWVLIGMVVSTLLQVVVTNDGRGFLRLIILPFILGCIFSDKTWIRVTTLLVVSLGLLSIFIQGV